MKDTEIRFVSKPKIHSPIVIQGLPGIGLVGKIAADYLLSNVKAKKFCELVSPHFPPQVITDEDGMVRLVRNEFYYFKDKKRDFIIIVGDFQGMSPESQYEISGKILDVLEKYKPKVIYTLGGLGIGKVTKEPKVFGSTNSRALIASHKKAGVQFSGRAGGGIFGASGLVLGIGKLRGISGVCLMAETVGHVVDAKAAKVLLEKLSEVLKLKIDMRDLDKQAKAAEKELEKIQRMQEEQAQAMQMAMAGHKPSSDEEVMKYIR